MKKSMRVLALMVAMAASMTCLASCGDKENTESSSATESSAASSKEESKEEAKKPDKAVELSWIAIGGQPNDLDAVTEELNKYSADKIGVTCKWTYLDWGVWSDRVKAMLQAGEPFDIMFNNSDMYSSAIELGRFADITDILNETPDLKSFIPEKVWKGVQYKDGIYGVPTYKDSSQTQYWVWDKEIVEKYDIPYQDLHTLKEMDPYIRQLQDEINAGNITGTTYAYNTDQNGVNGQFMNYDAGVANLGVRYDDPDAKIVRILEQPEIMEQFEVLHSWYKDGIINPDAPTKTQPDKWVILGSAQGFPGAEATWAGGRGKDVVVEVWGGPIYTTGTIQGSINSISSSSKNKVEALKFLELCNTDSKMRNMLVYGIEGVHWTDNGDGTITKDEVKKSDYGPPAYSQATFFTMSPEAPNPADQWTKVMDWNDKATDSVLLGFSFDRAPVETQLAACNVVYEAYRTELYTGAKDPHEVVPKIYAEMENAGLNDIEAELQKQIDAFLGR